MSNVALRMAGLAPILASAAVAIPPTAGAAPGPHAAARPFAGKVAIDGKRRLYLECRGSGSPTVVLESGLGNAGDVWGGAFLKASNPAADPRQAVLPAVARFTRVCAYDRPGTARLKPGSDRFVPGRSDPVAMPRTAMDVTHDLHALVRKAPRAAGLRGPVVLVGHSVGGLTQRLYATRHPREVAGLVLIDATPDRYGARVDELAAQGLLTPEQHAALSDPADPAGLEGRADLERIDVDASGAEVRQAQVDTPLPARPLVFLSLPQLQLPPDWNAAAVAALQAVYRDAQAELTRLVPHARHVIARRSGHYIQLDQPTLVVDAIRRVVERARRAR